MLISPALAHGASGVESAGGFAPLFLLAVAAIVVVVLVAEKKWRQRGQSRPGGGK